MKKIFYDEIKVILPPVILSIITASFIAFSLSPISPYEFGVVFSEIEGGILSAALNALIYLLIAAIGGFLMYLLLVYFKIKFTLLKLLLSFLIYFSSTIILTYYVQIWFTSFLSDLLVYTLTLISVNFLAAFLAYLIIFNDVNVVNKISLIIYCGMTGAFLALMIPTWSIILVLIALSIYDIYSVRKGPIRKSLKNAENKIEKLNITYKGKTVEIGMGDLIFYSILPAHTLVFFSIPLSLIVTINIVIGAILSLKLLMKTEYIPGLPISILLSVIPVIICMFT